VLCLLSETLSENLTHLVIVQITISFAKIIVTSIQPAIAVIGRLPGTDSFGDVQQYPMALNTPGLFIVSLKSAWLCFANANLVEERYVSVNTTLCFFHTLLKI